MHSSQFEAERRRRAAAKQAARHALPTYEATRKVIVHEPEGGVSTLTKAIREAESTEMSREAHDKRAAKRAAHRNTSNTRNDFRQDVSPSALKQAAEKMRQDYDYAATKPLVPYLGEAE
jgi:hypothetical protein